MDKGHSRQHPSRTLTTKEQHVYRRQLSRLGTQSQTSVSITKLWAAKHPASSILMTPSASWGEDAQAKYWVLALPGVDGPARCGALLKAGGP